MGVKTAEEEGQSTEIDRVANTTTNMAKRVTTRRANTMMTTKVTKDIMTTKGIMATKVHMAKREETREIMTMKIIKGMAMTITTREDMAMKITTVEDMVMMITPVVGMVMTVTTAEDMAMMITTGMDTDTVIPLHTYLNIAIPLTLVLLISLLMCILLHSLFPDIYLVINYVDIYKTFQQPRLAGSSLAWIGKVNFDQYLCGEGECKVRTLQLELVLSELRHFSTGYGHDDHGGYGSHSNVKPVSAPIKFEAPAPVYTVPGPAYPTGPAPVYVPAPAASNIKASSSEGFYPSPKLLFPPVAASSGIPTIASEANPARAFSRLQPVEGHYTFETFGDFGRFS